jgi:hypothetical protein
MARMFHLPSLAISGAFLLATLFTPKSRASTVVEKSLITMSTLGI